jgi:hypothetical protein
MRTVPLMLDGEHIVVAISSVARANRLGRRPASVKRRLVPVLSPKNRILDALAGMSECNAWHSVPFLQALLRDDKLSRPLPAISPRPSRWAETSRSARSIGSGELGVGEPAHAWKEDLRAAAHDRRAPGDVRVHALGDARRGLDGPQQLGDEHLGSPKPRALAKTCSSSRPRT